MEHGVTLSPFLVYAACAFVVFLLCSVVMYKAGRLRERVVWTDAVDEFTSEDKTVIEFKDKKYVVLTQEEWMIGLRLKLDPE